jgi:hypothetical protein
MLVETFASLASPWPLKIVLDSVLGNIPLPHVVDRLLGGSPGPLALLNFAAIATVLFALLQAGGAYRDRGRRADGAGARVHREPARGVRHDGGSRWDAVIRRAAAADRDRAGDGARRADLDHGRAHVRLDVESERLVFEGLDRLRAGRTTFVIAHRLQTVRQADLILVLDAGRIVERGTHEELAARGGLYAEMLGAQGEAGTGVLGNMA